MFRETEEECGNGLEILKEDGDWDPVPVYPEGTNPDAVPPILVNLGDLLSYWVSNRAGSLRFLLTSLQTAGLLRSTVHRVATVDAEKDRYSIAYFCHPVDTSVLDPIPSDAVEEKAKSIGTTAEKRAMTAREHLAGRLSATYKWKDTTAEKSS